MLLLFSYLPGLLQRSWLRQAPAKIKEALSAIKSNVRIVPCVEAQKKYMYIIELSIHQERVRIKNTIFLRHVSGEYCS